MRHVLFTALAVSALPLVAPVPLGAQSRLRIAQRPGDVADRQANQEGSVRLNLGPEVPIHALLDYVSERLKIKILYDQQVANEKVTIRAPEEVPVSSLLGLLESILRIKGLALVDADQPGWKRVVRAEQFPAVAVPRGRNDIPGDAKPDVPVAQVFELRNTDPTEMDRIIKPFLTPQIAAGGQQAANSVAIKDQRLLVVTDFASNVLRIAKLVELIDQPKPQVRTEFLPLENLDASLLSEQLSSLIEAKARATGIAEDAPIGVAIAFDSRTNQLILIGAAAEIAEIREHVKSLDVPLAQGTKVYTFETVSADRIDRLMKELLGRDGAARSYRSAVDTEGNLLIVTAGPEIHKRIDNLKQQLDGPQGQRRRSPIRFYKLKHAAALDVLETIQAIESGQLPSRQRQLPTDGRYRLRDGYGVPGPNRSSVPGQIQPNQTLPGGVLPTPPTYRPASYQQPIEEQPEGPARPFRQERRQEPLEGPPNAESGGELVRRAPERRGDITADISSNTIIVIGEPDVQELYRQLIETLDKPRPQVLIEAKVVVIDTSDDYALGIEVSGGDRTGGKRLFSFSSFGLSEVNPITGNLAILPGVGFNGTLVDPDAADLIVRALATHRRARVLSAPKILVNDNATGLLTSVSEVPFTSVNASQTVATTSFAGFAEAGTTIAVTPHIGDADQLQVEYSVTMNNFTGTGTAGVPPPRQTDQTQSEVTIPDGHTIIVGGLNQMNRTESVDGIPILEDIPLIRDLTSRRSRQSRDLSLFIFLRPVILRDDKFRDLRYLSERDVAAAHLEPDSPSSEPLTISTRRQQNSGGHRTPMELPTVTDEPHPVQPNESARRPDPVMRR